MRPFIGRGTLTIAILVLGAIAANVVLWTNHRQPGRAPHTPPGLGAQLQPRRANPPGPLTTRALPAVLYLGRPHGQVLTVAEANRVLQAFWPLREQAASQSNTALLGQLETGAALEGEVSVFGRIRRAGASSPRTPRPMNATRLLVPRQDHFPAYFMAEVKTNAASADPVHDTEPYDELMVFSRPRAAAPWRLAIDPGFSLYDRRVLDRVALPLPRTGGQDELLAPAISSPWIAPGAIYAELGGYYRHWAEHRRHRRTPTSTRATGRPRSAPASACCPTRDTSAATTPISPTTASFASTWGATSP